MTDSNDIQELLAAYAAGALEQDERDHVETLIAADPTLAHELELHMAVTTKVASGIPQHEPPAALKSRVMHAALGEPALEVPVKRDRSQPVARPRRSRIAEWFQRPAYAWSVAGVAIVFVALLTVDAAMTRSSLDNARGDLQAATDSLKQARTDMTKNALAAATTTPLATQGAWENVDVSIMIVDDQAVLVARNVPSGRGAPEASVLITLRDGSSREVGVVTGGATSFTPLGSVDEDAERYTVLIGDEVVASALLGK